MASVVISGFVGADPELRFTQNGKAVATFNVAETYREHKTWYRVTAWERTAEAAAAVVRKGSLVVISGRLQMETYETAEGETRNTLAVVADEVGIGVTSIETYTHQSPKVYSADGGAAKPKAVPERKPTAEEEPF